LIALTIYILEVFKNCCHRRSIVFSGVLASYFTYSRAIFRTETVNQSAIGDSFESLLRFDRFFRIVQALNDKDQGGARNRYPISNLWRSLPRTTLSERGGFTDMLPI
jgi:hypothetical protein